MIAPRIILLTTYYYPFIGGGESHARRLASYLARHGIGVVILTKRVDRHSPALEKIDGVPVYRIPPAGERSMLQKWMMIPFAIFALLRLRKKFDVIYCPGYRAIGIAAIGAGKLLRRPVILRAGNNGILSCRNWDSSLARCHLDPQGLLASLIKRLVRKTYASATAFACISREIEAETLQCGILPQKVHYLPNGVDTQQFRPPMPGERDLISLEEKWPQHRLVCMYVGRLSAEKGILDLLEAWRALKDLRTILIVVGPDMPGHHMDVGPAVREYVAEHRMQEGVILYGRREDIPRLLRAADLFIQPSHYEAFSNSVIEAMATGLPLVASQVGGMMDCLVDGVNALLCKPASPAALAMQIRRLLDDQRLRAELGREARATVERDYDESLIFAKFARLFRESAGAGSV
jgi:glycosyltransferase involved in cell wall biosynthesis